MKKLHNLYRSFTYLNRVKQEFSRGIPVSNIAKPKDKFSNIEIQQFLFTATLQSGNRSLFSAYNLLPQTLQDRTPSPKTVHNRLQRLSEDSLDDFAEDISKFIRSKALKYLQKLRKRSSLWLAIDAHDIPCYSKQMDLAKGKAKASTNSFIRVVVLYLVHPGRPLFLGIRLKRGSDNKSEALYAIDLLQELRAWLPQRFHVNFLGDGKYFHVYLLNAISELSWTYIIRARRSGKFKEICTSKRAIALQDGHGFGISHIANAYGVTKVPVRAIIGRRGDEIHVFVTNRMTDSPTRILGLYKRRFRIECAFRAVKQLFIRTCSLNFAVRFQIIAFAFIIHFWLELNNFTTYFYTNTLKLQKFVPAPEKLQEFVDSILLCIIICWRP